MPYVRLELNYSDGESSVLMACVPKRQRITKVKITGVDNLSIAVKKLHPDAIIPERQTALSSGLDLHALDVVEIDDLKRPYASDFGTYTLEPGFWVLVKTGLALQMPSGMEAQVRPRSGLALKHGITVLNSPGTIDADFIGDVGIILVNLGREPFELKKGDRVAQLVWIRY